MELSLEYWFLFPISAIIATIAMASGIGGAVFFSPLFMLALQLDAKIAVGTALITELFGFTSGLIAYIKTKLIDYHLAKNLLLFSIPFAILGLLIADYFPDVILKTIFAVGLIFIGLQLFTSWRQEEREKHEAVHEEEFKEDYESCLIDNEGHEYRYTICNKNMGRMFAAIGGAFVSMISVGLAELQEYQLVARCKVPTPVAIATSIFVVVITLLVASAGHIYEFASGNVSDLSEVINLAIFTVPGVILGGQIGPKVQKWLPDDKTKISISILFLMIGVFMLITVSDLL